MGKTHIWALSIVIPELEGLAMQAHVPDGRPGSEASSKHTPAPRPWARDRKK